MRAVLAAVLCAALWAPAAPGTLDQRQQQGEEEGNPPRGVAPGAGTHTTASTSAVWQCLDGSGELIPASRINDDYCDCADGSDEPGTPACAGVGPAARYYCVNTGYLGQYVTSSRVNDGICDCCDGADEWSHEHYQVADCPNSCAELGRQLRRSQQQRAEVVARALRAREALAEEGRAVRRREQAVLKEHKFTRDAARPLYDLLRAQYDSWHAAQEQRATEQVEEARRLDGVASPPPSPQPARPQPSEAAQRALAVMQQECATAAAATANATTDHNSTDIAGDGEVGGGGVPVPLVAPSNVSTCPGSLAPEAAGQNTVAQCDPQPGCGASCWLRCAPGHTPRRRIRPHQQQQPQGSDGRAAAADPIPPYQGQPQQSGQLFLCSSSGEWVPQLLVNEWAAAAGSSDVDIDVACMLQPPAVPRLTAVRADNRSLEVSFVHYSDAPAADFIVSAMPLVGASAVELVTAPTPVSSNVSRWRLADLANEVQHTVTVEARNQAGSAAGMGRALQRATPTDLPARYKASKADFEAASQAYETAAAELTGAKGNLSDALLAVAGTSTGCASRSQGKYEYHLRVSSVWRSEI